MGLSQIDTANHLNESNSTIQRLLDKYESEDNVARSHVPDQSPATKLAEGRFSYFGSKEKYHYWSTIRCRPFYSISEKNLCYYSAKDAFTMQVSVQDE